MMRTSSLLAQVARMTPSAWGFTHRCMQNAWAPDPRGSVIKPASVYLGLTDTPLHQHHQAARLCNATPPGHQPARTRASTRIHG